jgi:hypothetical protein
MSNYTMILVEHGLLQQVVTELLALAKDPDHVRVTHGLEGQVILAEPRLADRWYNHSSHEVEVTPVLDEPVVKPAKRAPGRPRKATAPRTTPSTVPQPVGKTVEDAAFASWVDPGGMPPTGEEPI